MNRLDEAETKPETPAEAREYLSRWRNVLGGVIADLQAADPEVVPGVALNALVPTATSIRDQLTAFVADQDPARVSIIDAEVDTLLSNSAPIRFAARGEKPVADVQAAVTAFRRSSSQLLRGIEVDVREESQRIAALAEEINKQESELQTQQGRLDSAISLHVTQFAESEAKREAASADALTTARNELETTTRDGREALRVVGEEGKAALDGLFTTSEHEADARIERLNELLAQAQRVVLVTANTGLTGGYQRVANEEQATANRWRWISLGALAAAALGNAVVLAFELLKHVTWETMLAARLSISIPLLGLAGYAIAESAAHRKQERGNRQFELQLASIGPYLADLDDAVQAEIRIRIFDRFFPGRTTSDLPDSPPDE